MNLDEMSRHRKKMGIYELLHFFQFSAETVAVTVAKAPRSLVLIFSQDKDEK